MILGGINFRFIDTAGLRETQDTIEAMGVERTRDRMRKASLIIYLFDLTQTSLAEILKEEEEVKALNIPYLKVGNKVDKADPVLVERLTAENFTFISAAEKRNIHELKDKILSYFLIKNIKTGDIARDQSSSLSEFASNP